MWHLKYDTNGQIYKTETGKKKPKQVHRHGLVVASGRRGERLGAWDQQMQTLTCRMDAQQGPTG